MNTSNLCSNWQPKSILKNRNRHVTVIKKMKKKNEKKERKKRKKKEKEKKDGLQTVITFIL